MTNFDTAREALETSLSSEGSAMKEHEKWSESIEAHLNRLSASWQSFAQTLMDSDALKSGIDILSGLLGVLEKLVDTFGGLGTISLGVFGKSLYNAFAGAKEAKATLNDVVDAIRETSNATKEASAASVASDEAEAAASEQAANAEMKEVTANEASAMTENHEASANNANTSAELGDALASEASANAELKEAAANEIVTATETEEAVANEASANAELKEATASAVSAEAELKESNANVANAATEAAEATANLTSATTEAAESAVKAAGGFKAFWGALSTGSKVMLGVTAAITVISFIVNAVKKAKEEASALRQEAIEASDKFLDAADSFEQAYIKYSDRTDLTVEEEKELESAINGTVDALGDKSSALHNAVNSSNDYVASLERIADAELKAASHAALNKKNNAQLELENAAKGWFGDSTVDVFAYTNSTTPTKQVSAIKSVIDSMDSRFVQKNGNKYSSSFSFELPNNASINEIINYYYTLVEYKNKLDEAAQTQPDVLKHTTYKEVTKAIEKMSGAIEAYESGVYDAAKAQYQLSEGIPKTTEEYLKMREAILRSDDVKNLSFDTRLAMANALESEYKQIFDLSSAEVQARKFIGLIEGYGDGTKDGTNEIGTVETFLNMRTAVNDNECSVGEYLAQFDEIDKMTEKWSDEEKELLNTSLGLDVDAVKTQYNEMLKYLSRNSFFKTKNDIADFLGSLTADELTAVVDIKTKIDWKNTSQADVRKQIEDQVKLNEALNYTIAIDVEAESVEALNTALAESVSATGLSSESIAALKGRYADLESEGYNLSAMFEETSNGIHLNRNAVKKLEKAYANDKLSETNKQLGTLKDRYDELAKEIKECDDVNDRADLYKEQKDIVDKINDLATLASQYKGLTSAYNEWLSVEESGQERDMYENILEGFENIDDEISRGWLDDGTIEFLELLTGRTDLATLSAKQLKEVYKGLDTNIKNTTHSIRDFFTVDEDGNSTSRGVYNFLDAIGQLEEEEFGGKDIVKRNKDGKVIGFDIELADGEKAIADALGISEELVQIMLRAADDAGFVVNLEGAYTQLADLKTEAELARDTLISLQEKGLKNLKGADVNFNLDAEGNDLVSEHEKAVQLLDKFKKDGKINLKMEGAQEALDIAEYLTIKLDDLTEPRYMQIDVTKVDEELQDPIEKMQEFGDLVREKHLVTLTGNTEDLEETETKMKKVAEELEDLDPEIKAKVGIKDGWSAEEIADKLEKGEIEIPADVKLDVQMSDDLKDMRLMMMNQLGLVSDNEVKLKVGFDIDESVVNELTEEEQEVVIKYIAENKEEFDNYTEEEKEAVVKLVADGVDLEKYEPKDKEAIVNYIANGEEVDGWTPEAKDAFVKYLVDGGDPDKFDPEDKDSWVVYDTDTTKPDGYEPDDEDATVTYDKDSSVPDGYDPNDPTATVTYQKNSSDVDNYNPPNFIRSVIYKVKTAVSNAASKGAKVLKDRFGIGEVNGTANVNGSAFVNGISGRAFRQGDWRTKKAETALVGELGREIVVTPENRWYTIGDAGAQFARIPKGSIIFNHKQSEELLKYGKVTSDGGRAKALVNGTAFAQGTAYATLSGDGIEPEDNNDEEQTFDWIETLISRLERTIDKLDKTVNNVYKSWDKRNTALTKEISKVNEEIVAQNKAANIYLEKANSVDLNLEWREKIEVGEFSIEDETDGIDEGLAEKIKEYEKWYNLYLECIDAAEELKQTEAELYAQRFENIQSEYDGILQGYEHTESMLNEYISQAEAKGHIVSKNYYDALIDNEKNNIAELQKEQSDLIAKRDEAVASGAIVKGSQAWYDMCAEIDSVTQAIEEGATALIEYDNAIRDLDWEVFDLIQERISDVIAEADFLIDLMSNDKLFDDNGKLTDKGMATMGLHGQNYNTYMYQADDYGAKVKEIDNKIASGKLDGDSRDVIDKRREYVELQREAILNAEDEKQAIKDLVEEGINLELDALQERIDLHNEELDSMKDLYDYQKNVQKQSEEIASLEKQRAAYLNDDSEENKLKLQEITVSLKEAKENLQETEYDRYISDQSALLDSLYEEYELILNQRLDNVDALLAQVIDAVNIAAGSEGAIATALSSEGAIAKALGTNTTTIKTTLETEAKSVGTTLSTAIKGIWSVDEGNAKSVITEYGKGFQDKQTTTNAVLGDIKAYINRMVDDVDKDATTKVNANKTTASAKKDPTKKTNSTQKKKTATTDKSSGDGIPKAGDKVKFLSGKYYYDSQGVTPAGSKNHGKYVYITNVNNKKWATHPIHISTGKKLGSGDLGWLKKNQISGYATGKKNFLNNEIAWTQENGKEFIVRPSDGAILTPIAKGDSVLTSAASSNIWDMANSPTEFIKDNLNLGVANVPNNSNIQNVYSQNLDKVIFNLPNVKNYEELLSALQKDPKFDKLVKAMTIDQIAGKSSLAKNKSIR